MTTQCLVAARNHSWLIEVKSITAGLGRRFGRGVSRSSASTSHVSRSIWETPPNSSKVRSMIRHARRPLAPAMPGRPTRWRRSETAVVASASRPTSALRHGRGIDQLSLCVALLPGANNSSTRTVGASAARLNACAQPLRLTGRPRIGFLAPLYSRRGLAEPPDPEVPAAHTDVGPGVGRAACHRARGPGRQRSSDSGAPLLPADPEPVTGSGSNGWSATGKARCRC